MRMERRKAAHPKVSLSVLAFEVFIIEVKSNQNFEKLLKQWNNIENVPLCHSCTGAEGN